MSKEKAEIPAWFLPMQTLGIPTIGGVASAPIYNMLKYWQNYHQVLKEEKHLKASDDFWRQMLKFRGLPDTIGQSVVRMTLRTGPVPFVQRFAAEHRPNFIGEEKFRMYVTLSTIIWADIANIPSELMTTKKQTYELHHGQSPSFPAWWKERTSSLEFLHRIYGGSSVIAAFSLRSVSFLAPLMVAQHQINLRLQPQSFRDQMVASFAASTVGASINALTTPLSTIQQKTMKMQPLSFGDAAKAVLTRDLKTMYAGLGSRFAIGISSGFVTLAILASQQRLESRVMGR